MLDSLKHFARESWLLVVASVLCGLLLAATNAALGPRIEVNKALKLTSLAGGLLPAAQAFAPLSSPVEVKGLGGETESAAVFRATTDDQTVGWVFKVVGSGFADKIELVVAADASFSKLVGYDVVSSSETPGFGDQIKDAYYRNQFTGAPVGQLSLVGLGAAKEQDIDSTIVAISGATISSTAVVQAMNHYLPQLKDQLQQKGLIGHGNNP
ncbi:MAG: FMN-binding protein [Sedimentisphaerales bacterium]|nr:FMN-binding protein [Sedimentisphaerales bacterium]HNY77905.1 FMN-binding protein [Sedimentisphaerales bacterium]HOC63301.1 FMN-binding protein [Sedimentisphaerales bacterium]HOH64169.1 FMN-binding protein [Sedimentisphaerales bacterium]HQA90005.1 FMN-binding protein [Sedimentisphaerales bacterium]